VHVIINLLLILTGVYGLLHLWFYLIYMMVF
jgi:hypothetical protein